MFELVYIKLNNILTIKEVFLTRSYYLRKKKIEHKDTLAELLTIILSTKPKPLPEKPLRSKLYNHLNIRK